MIDVVVARYKENLNWLDNFIPTREIRFFIYDKDPSSKFETNVNYQYTTLLNVGREAHTFLYHIVNNYDNLADEVLFLQGNPFDHEKDWQRYQNFIDGKANYEKYETFDIVSTQTHFFEMGYRYMMLFKDMFGNDKVIPQVFEFSSGAQYIVKKEAILNKPLEFWQKLLNFSLEVEQFTWDVERLWMYLYAN